MCEICRSHPCNARCPNASGPEIMDNCVVCDESLREDYTYFEDSDGNIFCSQECAVKYHGIEEKEWDNE